MAISTYTELQAAVVGWLNRDDLAAQIPDFIRLAEASIARRLRHRTTRASLTIFAESTALPPGCAELRSLHLVTGRAYLDAPIPVVTPEMLAEVRARHAGAAGRPVAAAIIDKQLVVAPVPDGVYTADVVYFDALAPLSATSPTNPILTVAPDLYLFGALKEAEAYMEHDERIGLWTQKFEAALAELEIARQGEEMNASLRPMRLPVRFG